MKKVLAVIAVLGIVSLSAGCAENKTKVAEGSVIGGLLGAAAGAGIGSLSGHAGAGAGIGAAVGALGGAAVGAQLPKEGQQSASETAQAGTTANPNQMAIQQIVDLTKQGVSEQAIIDKITLSNSKFNLTTADIDYLKKQGVSSRVIDAMLRK